MVQPIVQSVLVLDFTCLRRRPGSYLADLLNQFPVGVVLCFCPLSLSVCCSDCVIRAECWLASYITVWPIYGHLGWTYISIKLLV